MALRAGRPVGAAETRVGQPDGGPADHIEDHGGQGDPAEEEERARADTQGGHRPTMVPAVSRAAEAAVLCLSDDHRPALLRRLSLSAEVPVSFPLMALSAVALTGRRRAGSRIGAYVALTKPRIIELLLVTTLPTMIVAQRGLPSAGLMVATLLGGALAAGGANAINMYVDRDIDKVMHRTRNRPLVTGAIAPPRRPHLRHRPRGGGLRRALGAGSTCCRPPWPSRPRSSTSSSTRCG